MNTAVIIDSLKYLSCKFSAVSKLSTWIYKSLVTAQYSEYKIKQVIKEYDSVIVKELIHLVVDKSIIVPYIDDYCFGKVQIYELISIIILFYHDTFDYKKEEFIKKTILLGYYYELINICNKPLLNKLLDKSIIDKNYQLSFMLVSKGAALDKLTLKDNNVLDVLLSVITLLAKNMDKSRLYQELVQLIKIKKGNYIVGAILIENPFLKDQFLFELVIKQKIYCTFETFLRDGFDAKSIIIDNDTPEAVVQVVQKYRQVQSQVC